MSLRYKKNTRLRPSSKSTTGMAIGILLIVLLIDRTSTTHMNLNRQIEETKEETTEETGEMRGITERIVTTVIVETMEVSITEEIETIMTTEEAVAEEVVGETTGFLEVVTIVEEDEVAEDHGEEGDVAATTTTVSTETLRIATGIVIGTILVIATVDKIRERDQWSVPDSVLDKDRLNGIETDLGRETRDQKKNHLIEGNARAPDLVTTASTRQDLLSLGIKIVTKIPRLKLQFLPQLLLKKSLYGAQNQQHKPSKKMPTKKNTKSLKTTRTEREIARETETEAETTENSVAAIVMAASWTDATTVTTAIASPIVNRNGPRKGW